MRIEQTVHKAKVPIVRLFDSKLELACDINVNNTLALHNTRLIRNYVSIDPRVRPLAMVVKHWARRRVLNDAAKGGTISTYTWTCIILNFLQMRDPPILPVLHNIPHEGVDPIVVNGEDASFYENVESLRQFGSSNKESLGGLLFAFFRRMAFEFDYDNHVISLRQGKYLTKAEKGWDTCKGWKMLCVEEPFNTARNLGNSADDVSVNGLREEFRRAYDILYETASLEKLCEEYHFPDPYSNYNNVYYYQNRYYNNNNNNKRVQHKRNNNNNNKTNGTWNVNKPGNRKQCIKSIQQNGQNNYLNHSTDNFYDVNGKSNYSQGHQDDEEDGSSMRRFDNNIPSLRQNGHYEESTVAPVSEYNTYPKRYYENNDGSIRKQFDSIHNQNRRQIQHHNVSKDDEQSRPQMRKNYIKKKNDDQFNNYSQSQNEHEGYTTRYFDTTSNQNQLVYKNNNQKADNIPYNKNTRPSRFPYSDQKSSYSQNTNISYDTDNNKYNSNSCLRLPNTPSDSDQKSFVAYNTYDQEKRTYYNKPYSNKREPIIDDSSSNSNFDRSNPNSKSGNKSNKNRNFKQTRQYQKSVENTDFTNLPYYNYNVGDNNSIPLPLVVTVSIQSDLTQQLYLPRQSNDGPVNYQRRLSHQSSSDGSNSQTSGNTSNTSYTNNSSVSKNSYQKNNSNQNNYYQQPNQPNQQNQNKPNINRKKKNNNNNMNGSGNGNFRLNSTANSSPSVMALNYNDSNYQGVPFNAQSQINQGQGHYGNEYNGNNDTNGYKIYNGSNNSYNSNYKNYNNNNSSNNWRNSNGNGNHTKTLNGSRNNNNNTNNGSKSVNNGNFSSQSVNGSYPRSNFNNNNNSYLRNQNNYNVNSNKSVNGNNFKSLDGNNNSNLQTKNFNSNNYSGQGQIKSGQTYNSKKNYRNKNARNITKVENKEDCVNHQQQYSQEERQNYHNIQSHQQKKVGQNGQNNNSGKGKGFKKNSYLKQNAEYQQQQ